MFCLLHVIGLARGHLRERVGELMMKIDAEYKYVDNSRILLGLLFSFQDRQVSRMSERIIFGVKFLLGDHLFYTDIWSIYLYMMGNNLDIYLNIYLDNWK